MRKNMDDTIAISNKVGYPDIFLTTTCNPQWPEIKNTLLPGQSVVDCAGLAARVFYIKLRPSMAFVKDEKVFGDVKAYVWVMQFQIRGLRHAHCIFFMVPDAKRSMLLPSVIDTSISAEIPSAASPVLR